ncbi:hypothetical protein NIES2135_63830 (plasmid) [Leptolyngbya boryana NIES-2135]|jgi:hypothetical protein|uniref:Uncharacterized protein n=1 Tax=Leptolyngbya boryana NIES-2135 TaxID=1973484 RepID=A0A1Z4JS43_LEPBY|nr:MULTISPECIES: hypothetical protein [Leptolyngbya]BAY59506.1 hypothetical protein NIES2135_63830 [Leptolyngbya boryana NIES-2135]MBD2373086.1 hypothetical protein [Leptolyngbya sp. FACHB-238]MBD2397159.1 hypothetical protein [Leptolyngbya sp. FACHB-239]MBD2404035.1 hypothetical protein [Leptolyngbya sp. FACHB-402]ULP33326.1 hypothetical protein MCP04_31675 [Leptolyngbya boryana IU 594]
MNTFYSFSNSIQAGEILSVSPTSSPSPDLPAEPLINHSWQPFFYTAAIVLVVCLAIIVGAFSRRVEHAIASALILSLVLIGFFFVLTR